MTAARTPNTTVPRIANNPAVPPRPWKAVRCHRPSKIDAPQHETVPRCQRRIESSKPFRSASFNSHCFVTHRRRCNVCVTFARLAREVHAIAILLYRALVPRAVSQSISTQSSCAVSTISNRIKWIGFEAIGRRISFKSRFTVRTWRLSSLG